MNKKGWLIPILIVAVNALAIIVRWSTLPELLPAHFDLEGNASGSTPRSVLPFYPLISAAVCLAAYVISRITHKLQTGMIILTSGICLVVLLSTMVTLTSGQMPVFMLAEPVVLLVAVTAFVICIVKAQKPSFKTKNNVQD